MIESEKYRIQTEVMTKMSDMKATHHLKEVQKENSGFLSRFLKPLEFSKKSNQKIKVLFCEDNRTLSLIIKKLLEAKGFEVTVSETPAHFLNKDRLDPFDLVITDNQMPYMTGTQFIEFVEKELKLDIPMYIYSGDPDLKQRIPLTKVLRGVFEKGAGFESVLQTILTDFKSYKDDLNAKLDIKLAITANTLMA